MLVPPTTIAVLKDSRDLLKALTCKSKNSNLAPEDKYKETNSKATPKSSQSPSLSLSAGILPLPLFVVQALWSALIPMLVVHHRAEWEVEPNNAAH